VLAIIPAAGFASRLKPLTDSCHKAMLPLGDTTMMAVIAENLRLAGIRRIIMITGYRADALKEYIRSIGDYLQFDFVHNPDFTTTNNAYSLNLAAPLAAGREFLLLDCDILFEPDVLFRVKDCQAPNAIAVQRRINLGDEEMKIYSKDGMTVHRITKGGDPQKAFGESVGIEKCSAGFGFKLFDTLDRRIRNGNGRTEFYEAAFQSVIDGGETLHMTDVTDFKVMEVDFPEDLRRAEKDILPFLRRIHAQGTNP